MQTLGQVCNNTILYYMATYAVWSYRIVSNCGMDRNLHFKWLHYITCSH